jgi:hypothetical protein
MNLLPFSAKLGKRRRHGRADFSNFGYPKSHLFNQLDGAVRTIQFEFRQRAITPHSVDMRGRVIVGLDRYSNVPDF